MALSLLLMCVDLKNVHQWMSERLCSVSLSLGLISLQVNMLCQKSVTILRVGPLQCAAISLSTESSMLRANLSRAPCSVFCSLTKPSSLKYGFTYNQVFRCQARLIFNTYKFSVLWLARIPLTMQYLRDLLPPKTDYSGVANPQPSAAKHSFIREVCIL